MKKRYDAIVVGSGPNGLAAAITVSQRGGKVLLIEAAADVGGGMRTRELSQPGFLHDVCSAVHPLAVSSPFMRQLPLGDHGLKWIYPEIELAHPLDNGGAAFLHRSLDQTAEGLGADAESYRKLMRPLVDHGDALIEAVMRPILHLPKKPLFLARFGLQAMRSAESLIESRFKTLQARALFAGMAAHAMIPLSWPGSAAVAMMLALTAHLRGWPVPQGGSQSIANAMLSYFKSLGGEFEVNHFVKSINELPKSRWLFLDITPRQLSTMAADLLTESQKKHLRRFSYGMGVYKMDFALSGAVPWSNANCSKAATVHLGATFSEIVNSELAAQGLHAPGKSFVLVTQPSLFDETRAPVGQQTLWAYCHVPHASQIDMSSEIENQIERFAPGFRSKILASSCWGNADFERYNPNYIGGDISGGAMNLRQMLFRPRLSLKPYSTPLNGVYLCSSSTPPGPGVHGMCGHLAALAAID